LTAFLASVSSLDFPTILLPVNVVDAPLACTVS
jgi:hypothetical protein